MLCFFFSWKHVIVRGFPVRCCTRCCRIRWALQDVMMMMMMMIVKVSLTARIIRPWRNCTSDRMASVVRRGSNTSTEQNLTTLDRRTPPGWRHCFRVFTSGSSITKTCLRRTYVDRHLSVSSICSTATYSQPLSLPLPVWNMKPEVVVRRQSTTNHRVWLSRLPWELCLFWRHRRRHRGRPWITVISDRTHVISVTSLPLAPRLL